MFTNFNEELISRITKYSPRRLDIIFSDPDDLDRYPTENELKQLVEQCREYSDEDAILELNSKYDLSFLDNEEEIEIVVTKEQREKAKTDFIAFMKKIHPNFNYESGKNE